MSPYVISKNLLKPIDHDFRSIWKRSKVSTFFCFYLINFQAMTLQQYLYYMAYTLQPFLSLFLLHIYKVSSQQLFKSYHCIQQICIFSMRLSIFFIILNPFILITITIVVWHTPFSIVTVLGNILLCLAFF